MPRLPRPVRASRAAALGVGLTGIALVLAACGSDPAEPTATQEAQVRAQAGLLSSYTATYAVKDAKGADSGELTVARTPTTLRLDVKTAGGTSTSITTPQRTVACQAPANGKAPTCLTVAGAGQTPPAALDPVLRKVFGDALRVLAAEGNGLTVAEKTGATATPASTTAAGETARCFSITAPAAQATKIATGVYCLTSDGIPVGLEFASGTATLKELSRSTPAAKVFEPATSPTPLPTS